MAKQLAVSNQLTEKQWAYVKALVSGTEPENAALLAGYAFPLQAAHELKHNPTVLAAITAELRRFLTTQAAPRALQLMYAFMVDDKKDDKIRLACAKTLADRAGYIAPKAKDNSGLDAKSIVDMTREEMIEAASRIQKELSDRAVTIIDSVPDMARNDTQDIDLLE